jgi:hypothetical protein
VRETGTSSPEGAGVEVDVPWHAAAMMANSINNRKTGFLKGTLNTFSSTKNQKRI